jgi:hypothetical protein
VFLGFIRGGGKVTGRNFESPHDSFEFARRHRRQAEILQGEAESGMIGDGKKDDHRHFAVKTADV